jgi:hypothetical protein
MSRGQSRCILLAFSLWLMLAGSLFPPGYMPVGRADSVTIVLCSASGPRTVTLDLDRNSVPNQHSGSTSCDRVAALGAVLPEPPSIPEPVSYAEPLPEPPPSRIWQPFRSAFDPNAPPQAPPLLHT